MIIIKKRIKKKILSWFPLFVINWKNYILEVLFCWLIASRFSKWLQFSMSITGKFWSPATNRNWILLFALIRNQIKIQKKKNHLNFAKNFFETNHMIITYDSNNAYGKSCTIYQNCSVEQEMGVLLWVLVFLWSKRKNKIILCKKKTGKNIFFAYK